MESRSFAEAMQELERPNPARIYDYLLGGAHNFQADREAAEEMLAVFPDAALGARINRAFLIRAIRFLVGQGIDQFLDIGSGLPTVGSVHEIAQGANPEARVVYVDRDPVVVQYSCEILAGNQRAVAVQMDVRDTEALLAHPDLQRILDFGRPVGVLLAALLHFIPADEEAGHVLRALQSTICSGSYLVASHAAGGGAGDETEKAAALYRKRTAPGRPRTRAELLSLLQGLDLVEPGLVYAPLWRPEYPPREDPARSATWAAVGRKP